MITCPPAQSFCVASARGDACSARPCNQGQAATFRCTSLGYFPNVADCSSYYFCGWNEARTDFEATPQDCPDGNTFDPSSSSFCSRQSNNRCSTLDCGDVTTLTWQQLTYGNNRQYYALCIPNQEPRVFVCPDNSSPDFTSFLKCNYRCLRVGAFQNSLDSTKYFECFWNSSFRLESIERSCPARAEFNPIRSSCEPTARALDAEWSGEIPIDFVSVV